MSTSRAGATETGCTRLAANRRLPPGAPGPAEPPGPAAPLAAMGAPPPGAARPFHHHHPPAATARTTRARIHGMALPVCACGDGGADGRPLVRRGSWGARDSGGRGERGESGWVVMRAGDWSWGIRSRRPQRQAGGQADTAIGGIAAGRPKVPVKGLRDQPGTCVHPSIRRQRPGVPQEKNRKGGRARSRGQGWRRPGQGDGGLPGPQGRGEKRWGGAPRRLLLSSRPTASRWWRAGTGSRVRRRSA